MWNLVKQQKLSDNPECGDVSPRIAAFWRWKVKILIWATDTVCLVEGGCLLREQTGRVSWTEDLSPCGASVELGCTSSLRPAFEAPAIQRKEVSLLLLLWNSATTYTARPVLTACLLMCVRLNSTRCAARCAANLPPDGWLCSRLKCASLKSFPTQK